MLSMSHSTSHRQVTRGINGTSLISVLPLLTDTLSLQCDNFDSAASSLQQSLCINQYWTAHDSCKTSCESCFCYVCTCSWLLSIDVFFQAPWAQYYRIGRHVAVHNMHMLTGRGWWQLQHWKFNSMKRMLSIRNDYCATCSDTIWETRTSRRDWVHGLMIIFVLMGARLAVHVE